MGEDFAAVLRRHRRRAGLTQEALAECSGVSVRTIRSIELGKRRNPQLASLRQLAEALGLPAGELNDMAGQGPVPRQLPSDVFGFAGRTDELARLDAVLATDSS